MAVGEEERRFTMVKLVAFILIVLFIVFVCLKANGQPFSNLANSTSTTTTIDIKKSEEQQLDEDRSRSQDRGLSFSAFTGYQEEKTKPKCGQRMNTFDSRIVGGKRATITDFPWIVSVQREKGYWFGFKAFHHSCGGSLITPSWIVTAAHCFYNRDEPIRLVAGTDNLNFLYRAQLRSVSNAIVHPEFDISTYDNDIALIKASRPFNLESSFSHVAAICLEPNIPVIPYDIATVAGFGAPAFHSKIQTHLHSTDIAIIDELTCNKSFETITDNMICAGGMIAHKRDACSGDSGGPLQMEGEDHTSLVGIVSFGNNCALKDFPGVYTRIDNYYNWVIGNIDEPLMEP